MVCTARHAINPPRAVTFLSTTSAADRLGLVEAVSAATAVEMAATKVMLITKNFLRINESSLSYQEDVGLLPFGMKSSRLALRSV
jgi:hypothetical protein